MTSIFLYCYCILRSIVTLNHRYICSQQTENHRPSAHVIDVATTCHSHIKIMPNILAAHGPSGCDIVSSYFGIGKKTVINMLSKKKYRFTYSVSDNLAPPASQVLIGRHLNFCSLTPPTCCSSPRKCMPVKYKAKQKAGFPVVTETPS